MIFLKIMKNYKVLAFRCQESDAESYEPKINKNIIFDQGVGYEVLIAVNILLCNGINTYLVFSVKFLYKESIASF